MVTAMRGLLTLHLKSEGFSGPSVVVFMADLVFCPPFTKADHQHPENGIFCPEPVFLTCFNHEFFMGFGMKELTVNFKDGTIIQEMKEFMAYIMGM
jgi:hypothetical protein